MTTPFRRPVSVPGQPASGQSAFGQQADKVEIIMPDQYADRRAEPRFVCDDRGALLLLAENKTVPCRILDQSASGARVAMENLTEIPAEIWLLDLDTHTVRRGTAAWSMANRMGLKFNFVQGLKPGEPRPAKVPQGVFDAWLRLSNAPDPKGEDDSDTLYFD
ncbi:hypothetical protein [Asticcacaulis sp. EMRT-3]|uniref:hypothetical protein n=1 Tax=Asticcacaulis sp. EMRT-3 TaxID=3040349 RepID=UPI0024AEA0A7|nr:hypothetical protein [Asticcacaulis sp. EMRT-3]MDI7775610.1 hypothetical protein [Asticcacaulis sp. EMRT-3]